MIVYMKKSYSILLVMLCLVLCNEAYSKARTGGIKLLVLLIASDDLPVYRELQKIWRSYMHLDPAHVEAYFMKSNPNLSQEVIVDGDVIWVKSSETIVPGLINKTIKSLNFLLPRFNEFDFILRANLSSFYVFPKLLQFLERLPAKKVYCGSNIGDPRIGSGCGFIMSPDIAQLLVAAKRSFIDNRLHNDDVLIGWFMIKHNIRLTPHERIDFYSLNDWERAKNNISTNAFHFRIKTAPNLRITDDTFIQKQLLRRFYNIDL